MSLSGKSAIVTGSSRGLGRAIAIGLACEGADVTINYCYDERSAHDTAEHIKSLGRRVLVVQADLTDPSAAATLVAATVQQLGDVDILVNNVGEFYFKPLAAMHQAEWDHVFDSNLGSVFHMCQAVIPGMRRRRQGQIINIGLSPTYMVRGAPNISAYAIAKTGVLILTRSLAVEEAPFGLRVNCVSPGLIDNGYLPPEQKSWMEKRVPMGRLGTPDDIANAVAFLASSKASYISGANLAVGGAWDWEDRPTNHDKDVHDLFLEKS